MLILWAGLAQAATWTVDVAGGADFTSINEAMLASSDGDVIEVADGVYAEPVYFSTHDVDLVSVGGGAVIDSSGYSEPTVTMYWNTDATEMIGFELITEAGEQALSINQASPIIRGLKISDHPGSGWGPPLITSTGGELTLEDCVFSGNTGGETLLSIGGGSVTLRSCEFSNNAGYAVYVQGSLFMEDCTLEGNAETYGLVRQRDARDQDNVVELDNTLWLKNAGSLLDLDADSVRISGDVFQDNELGGVSIESAGLVQIEDVIFQGTGLGIRAQDIEIRRVEITDFEGPIETRDIADLRSFGSVLVEDSEISRNITQSKFALFYVWAVSAEIRRVVVSGNEGFSAVDLSVNTLILEDFEVSEHQVFYPALQVRADLLESTGLVIRDNTGEIDAGAYIDAGQASFNGAQFTRNIAPFGAGGLNFLGEDLILRNTEFCGNKGQRGGGLNAYIQGSLEMHNSAFWDNEASEAGGATYLRGWGIEDSTISNNTFVANSAPDASGTYLYLGDVDVVNNVYAHHPGNAVRMNVLNYTGFWDNEQDYEFIWESRNELHEDPLFVDYTPDGKCNDKLWTLPGSPHRDAGDPSIRDLDGSVSDLGMGGGPGASSANFDGDGDGVPLNQDCDDADAQAGGGEEVPYDGLDNDCDETTPDDDLDGDGFGVDEDCDDQDAEVYPGTADCTKGDSGATDDEEYFELGESRCSCAQSPTTPIFWPALILGLAVLRRKTRPTQTRERSRTDR